MGQKIGLRGNKRLKGSFLIDNLTIGYIKSGSETLSLLLWRVFVIGYRLWIYLNSSESFASFESFESFL